MLSLTPHESRVLGVLVEKAQTTPQQYPLTLNALVNGSNQKNNREPVTYLTEEQVLQALDGLRAKGLVREVMLTGSRVVKYRHVAREALDIDTNQLVILTELLLRGPQTLGELRGRASRMHPLESTEVARNVLESLANRPEPLVRELPPAPGDRAPRYAQLLCPNLHPLEAPSRPAFEHAAADSFPVGEADEGELARRVSRLEQELREVREVVNRLAEALGEAAVGRGAE
jgi:uncharacterized protein